MTVLTFLDPTAMLLGLVLMLSLLWWLSTRRPPGIPPGPGSALPVIGHLHLMKKNPLPQFKTWRRQYGDVFSLYMGGRLMVVLNGYPVIKEALVKFADVFSHRPRLFMFDKIAGNNGMSCTSGSVTKEQRKVSLEILRELGMGKNVLADKIQEEATHYIRAIEKHKGARADLSQLTAKSISNNICSILFGKRFDYDDPSFNTFLSAMDENFRLLAGTTLLNFFPVLAHLPGDPFKGEKVLSNYGLVSGYIKSQIADHSKGEKEEENTDFIYAYRREIRRHEKSGNVNTSINDTNFPACVADLLYGGTETTTTALRWAMLLFLHYPEVQDKCYKEICDVIGPDQTPSMRHRQEMTYLEATTLEILRKGDVAPLSLAHGLSSDVTFRGYFIPKDAIVIPNLSSALEDSVVWGDPENFRPERFIGPDGKLKQQENMIPFSLGRRVCPGESLARMELFLYLSNLIQHFRFLPPEDGQLPSLEGMVGITRSPQCYEICAVPRH